MSKKKKKKRNKIKLYKENKKNKNGELLVSEELGLTKDEILFVKELYASRELMEIKQPLVVPQFSGDKKTTGISVYIDVWDRWGEFKNRHAIYSGTDLMALALEEFMEKYDATPHS